MAPPRPKRAWKSTRRDDGAVTPSKPRTKNSPARMSLTGTSRVGGPPYNGRQGRKLKCVRVDTVLWSREDGREASAARREPGGGRARAARGLAPGLHRGPRVTTTEPPMSSTTTLNLPVLRLPRPAPQRRVRPRPRYLRIALVVLALEAVVAVGLRLGVGEAEAPAAAAAVPVEVQPRMDAHALAAFGALPAMPRFREALRVSDATMAPGPNRK